MNRSMHALSLLAAAASLAAVAPLAAQNAPVAAAQAGACTLAFSPKTVTVQADPFQLAATPSQSVGAVSAAGIQEKESGLQVAVAPAVEVQAAAPSAAAASSANPAATPAPQAAPAQTAASAQAAAPAAQALQLKVNTAAAKPGDWTVTLQGASGTCSGKIHVDPAAPKQ